MVLRWGIVTAGKISHDFTNAVNSYPDKLHVIAAVAARDPTRAQQFANTHGIQHVFNSYEDMAKSDQIDVAYIGALNPDHYKLTKLFLESGKHVLCEKPLCMNEKQVRSLVDLASSKKLFLMEAVWSRFFPTYQQLKKELESGKLGEALFAEAKFAVPVSGVERVAKKDLGGSAMLDLGIYVLQFAQFVFKEEPIKITASGELNAEGVDVATSVILDYSGGRRAVVTAHGKLKLCNDATVTGTKGWAKLHDPFHCPEKLELSDGKVYEFPIHTSNIPYNFENSAGLVYEANEVKRCIENGLIESPTMSHAESLLLARIQDTIRTQIGVHYDADDQPF